VSLIANRLFGFLVGHGRTNQRFGLRPLTDKEKPEILKAYLDKIKCEVQHYFPVPAGSPAEAFRPLVQAYPAFELSPLWL